MKRRIIWSYFIGFFSGIVLCGLGLLFYSLFSMHYADEPVETEPVHVAEDIDAGHEENQTVEELESRLTKLLEHSTEGPDETDTENIESSDGNGAGTEEVPAPESTSDDLSDETDDPDPGEEEPAAEPKQDTRRILFIGDSRTIDMFADSDAELTGLIADGITVYARHGFGFEYMAQTVKDYGKDNYDVLVTWMGANDHGDFTNYEAFYDKVLESGKTLVVCTVGPTTDENLEDCDHPYYENHNMVAFNDALTAWAAQKGVKVIDLYSYIASNVQIDPADGIHYTPRPTTDIWNYIIANI